MNILCLRNIIVKIIFKQKKAIYKKKEFHFPTYLWPIAQWLEKLGQAFSLTQLISAIYQLEFHWCL